MQPLRPPRQAADQSPVGPAWAGPAYTGVAADRGGGCPRMIAGQMHHAAGCIFPGLWGLVW